jgi:ComF family protein
MWISARFGADPGAAPSRWRRLGGAAVALAGQGLDVLLPPQCLACDAPTTRQGAFCQSCFRAVTLIAPPLCTSCGLPFASKEAAGPDGRCARCAVVPRSFARARAALLYTDAVKPVLLGFKHADRTTSALPLARLMARAGAVLLAECDLLAPVPLHRGRLLARRYNQSALLAHALARLARRPHLPDLLRRTRATPSLGNLPAAERARLLDGAIAVARPDRAQGRRVLVIDDVMTSGATAEACALALLAAGAVSVDILAAARVPLGRDEMGREGN